MHRRAMLLLKKEQSSNVTEYAPIARALHKIDDVVQGKIKLKFDVAYLMVKEGIV